MKVNLKTLITLIVLVGLALMAVVSYAIAPVAGTMITNQFTVEYSEAGATRTSASNTVTAVVLQVANFAIDQDTNKTGTIGQTVSIQHRITNTGNGPDAFDLSQAPYAPSDFTLLNVAIYPDLDSDGIADSGAQPITQTPTLATGETYSFIVQATIPNSATVGQASRLMVQGRSVFDNTVIKSNIDIITVSALGLPLITKSMSANSGLPGTGPYTIRITANNNTLSTLSKVVVTDALPAGFEYVVGSGRWVGGGDTPLVETYGNTDIVQSGSYTLNYQYNSATREVIMTGNNFAAGFTGYVEFKVNVTSNASGVIQNHASYVVNDTATGNTNTVLFTVNPYIDFSVTGETIPSALQGSVVTFTDSITNLGNDSDHYSLYLDSSNFPAGTTFQVFRADGITLLTDTDSDGKINTANFAPGETINYIIKAYLPAGVSGGGPYVANYTVYSEGNPSVTRMITNTLTTITAASVVLTDSTGAKDNTNLLASQIITTNPGQTVVYELKVANNAAAEDIYNYLNTLTAAGYTVKYKEGSSYVSTTGLVSAGASKIIGVEVTVPANATPATINFAVSVTSSTTPSITDSINLRLVVNANREVVISPNNVGTTFAGGNIIYSHLVTNNGTVAEDGITIATADTNSAFNSITYVDANGDGVWDANDTQTDTIANLAAGAHTHVFILVIAAPNVIQGVTDVTTVTLDNALSDLSGVLTATDTTTVTVNSIKLELYQKIDTATDYTTSLIQRKPGDQIDYKLVVTNQNAIVAPSTKVNVTVPGYTSAVGSISMKRNSVTSTIGTAPYTYDLTDLQPGEIVEFYYSLKVSQ